MTIYKQEEDLHLHAAMILMAEQFTPVFCASLYISQRAFRITTSSIDTMLAPTSVSKPESNNNLLVKQFK